MKPQPKMRYAGAFAVLLALLAVLFVWNVNSGSLHLSVREVAQILLTADDIADPVRHENFQNTIQRLLELDAIPIVNENDTVSVAEFGIGDNDTLSAIVATSVHADLLVLLSDIDGLYTADPHKDPDAARIELVPEITDEILRLADGKGSELGTGGMKTKLSAAKIVTKAGTDMKSEAKRS